MDKFKNRVTMNNLWKSKMDTINYLLKVKFLILMKMKKINLKKWN